MTAVFLAALAAMPYAAVKSDSGHYLLLFPSSTIETDLYGRCVRVRNESAGIVYLPMTSAGTFADALKAYPRVLKIEDCARK